MQLALKIFFAGILLSCLAFSEAVLDSTLLPRMLMFALIAFITLIAFFRKKLSLQIDLPIIIYAAYCFYTMTGISYSINKSEAIFESARTTLGFLCFVLTLQFLKTDKQLFIRSLQRIAIVFVFVCAFVAAWQSKKYDASQKDALYIFTGISGHKNLFASFLFLNLFFLVFNTSDEARVWKFLRATSIIITILILAFIRTKAVYLGLIFTVSFYVLFYFLTKKNIRTVPVLVSSAITLVLLNIFILVICPKIIDRTLTYNSQLTQPERHQKELDNERILLWQKTYGIIDKHQLFGAGPGNWQINFPDETLKGLWRAEDLNYTFQRPHNDLLWILSETGIIGFNLYFLFIILIVFSVIATFKHQKQLHAKFVSISFIIGYFVISFFDFPKERMEHILFLNIILAFSHNQAAPGSAWKSYDIKPLLYLCGGVLAAVAIVISSFRIYGELNLRKLYQAKYAGENGKVLIAAGKAYRRFYTLDPTSVPLKWYSGNAHAANNNYEKAFVDFKQAYRDNPFNRNVLNDLGSAYAMLGRNDSAKILYLEAARISPRFDDAKLNLTAIYIREQNFKSADSCLNTLLHDSERRAKYQKMVNTLLGKNS